MANQAWYFGSIGNSQFHIKREDDHIFFSKYYPEIRVSWQFNSAGRIDRITGRKSRLPSQQTSECFVTLVSIDKHQNPEKEKAWIDSTATLFPLPRELDTMNWKFAQQPYYQQYLSLFTFGHHMVRECFAGIVQGSTIPRLQQKGNLHEFPLSDIQKGMLEYAILEQASHLKPRAFIESRSQAQVRYETYTRATRRNIARDGVIAPFT